MSRVLRKYRAWIIFWVGLCLAGITGYYTYSSNRQAGKMRRKARRFAEKIRRYEAVSARQARGQSDSSGSEPKNVLSYLESKVSGDKLAELSPVDTESPPPEYRLQLSGIKLASGLKVIAGLEKEAVVKVKSLSLERIGSFAKEFDIYLHLVEERGE